ncbi:hypothetical protein FRC16_004822 [Serendipita sp. 398]|nr:hypothetical protein FRC16_004822 [Serendipita sp. 398]
MSRRSKMEPVSISKGASAHSANLSPVASTSTSRANSASSSLTDKSYTHSSSSTPSSPHFDIPFLGTPFALERPYEYPFPSPATESFPNLALSSINAPYNHVLATNTMSDTPPTMSSTGLVNTAFALQHHVHPPSSFVHQNTSIFKRRSSSAGATSRRIPTMTPVSSSSSSSSTSASTLSSTSHLPLNQKPPVPPGLLGRDVGPLSPRLRAEATAAMWRRNQKLEERKS